MRYKRIVNNRKGFTLVEMLVALSISALLFVIAIPSISFIQETLEKRKFESYKDAVKSATKLYAQSYKEDLVFNASGYYEVGLDKLIEKDLIEDYSTDIICKYNSGTKIIQSGDKYKYCVTLKCTKNGKEVYSGRDSSSYCKVDFKAPDVKVKVLKANGEVLFSKEIKNGKYDSNKTISLDPNKWFNKITAGDEIKIQVDAEDDNLSSIDIGGQVVTNKNTNTVTYSNDFSGTINIIVKDEVDNTINVNLNLNYDKTLPECGELTGDNLGSWSKEKTLYMGCTDVTSKCEKDKFSKTLTNASGKTEVSIDIKDKAGNTKTCKKTIDLQSDSTPPTCDEWSGESTTWTSGSRTISVKCNDSGSGCKNTTVSKTVESEGKTATVKMDIEDNAGNKTTCQKTVNTYIDTSNPSCGGWSGEGSSWTNGNRTISVGCSDSVSGCKQATYSTTITAEGRTAYVSHQIEDNAGHKVTCAKTASTLIDKTPPTRGATKSWKTSSDYGAWFYVYFNDNLSGLKKFNSSTAKYCYSKYKCKKSAIKDRICNKYVKTQMADSNNISPGALSGKASSGFSSSCAKGGGKVTTWWNACDYAGNCQVYTVNFSW